MPNQRNTLQRVTLPKFATLWLGIYACGALMVVASIATLFGAVAAGSSIAFFILAAVFGYETLTRRTTETSLQKKVENLDQQQHRLVREIARTRNDVDALKDDMVQTALTLQKEMKKYNALIRNEDAPAQPSGAFGSVKKSLEKMGNRMRPSSIASFMPRQKPANEAETAPNLDKAKETLRKYKDIMMSTPNEEKLTTYIDDEPMPEYSKAVLSELIHHAVQNDKIEIFAQPIVKLPSRRMTYLELFARIRARAGIYLPADTYRPLAEEETTIENVDHALLLHTIDTIRADARRGIEIGYFINICASTFKNQRYMTDLLEFLKSRRDLAHLLVFELQYKEYNTLPPQLIRIIDGLSRLGCKFSIDNLPTWDVDDDMLAENGINFLKIDARTLVDLCSTQHGEMDLAKFKSRLDRSGLELIVEKFESEQDLIELLDFEIDYGEGYLFGKPDLEMAYRKQVA